MVYTCVYSAPAHAAYSNANSILLGERAAGMGGAFTALTGDPSATPFYNPATTVLQLGSSLSASVNVYNRYATTIGDTSDFGDAPQRLNRGFFRSLPSASGTVLNFKSFAVGLSIVVPDYDFYSGQLKGTGDTSSSLSFVDESLWVGGTFSGKLTPTDAIGVSVYYTARSLSRTANDRVTTGGGTGVVITSEEKNLTSNAVVAVFGYHRKLSPLWSVGVSYRPTSLPIAGEASYFKSVTETTPFNSTVLNRGNLRAVTKIPSRLAVGVAREVKNGNTISFDLQLFEGTSYRDLPELAEGAEDIHHRQHLNFALGYEQLLRKALTLRLGAFSNLSAYHKPDLKYGTRQGDQVDQNGFSANINFVTDEKTWFTVGGYYSGGSGESTQLVNRQLQIVPRAQQTFTMLIATGFAF